MSNNDSGTELLKLADDGINNNYSEWETKSYHKLLEWDLLKYIEGPTSQAPIIPPLRHTVTHHGLDEDGHPHTIHVLGNQAEHEQALRDAIPWMTGNKTALARIVSAVPGHQLYLVKRAQYAKQAWENLRSMYRLRNSFRAATIKRRIMAYRCEPDMDIAKWLTDIQRLYISLCKLDTDSMSDHDFALAILVLMPQPEDEGWTDFLSGLRAKARDSDSRGLPIDSTTFITTIRDYLYSHNLKDDCQTTPPTPSAQRRVSKKKRARTADISTAASAKRARTQEADKVNRQCTNPFCGSPRGSHDTADCVAYQGAKEGQYGDWWRGPWNLHLPESQRTKENNKPPKKHPVLTRWRIRRLQ
jgi:hypothetical protein